MVFPSFEFAIFFPVVLALSWALMPRPALWKPFILAASYVFYSAASVTFTLILLAGVALANQLGAQLVDRAESERRKTQIMAATVALDLGVLGLFKYYGFFTEEFGTLLGSIGLGMPLPLLELALPIGLSFWIFQAISYVVDVRRGLLPPAKTIDVMVYLAFFPHVVAGPIVRAREFIPQLSVPRNPRDVAVGPAVVLIGIGLIKKVAIADYLARTVVDPVFGVPSAYSAPDVAARRLRLRRPDLLRLLRLHRHRDRRRAAARLRLPAELQLPLPLAQLPRVLAALAHHALALPARLPLHPARRQPRRQAGRPPAT